MIPAVSVVSVETNSNSKGDKYLKKKNEELANYRSFAFLAEFIFSR